jgi:acyl-coenzyme A synthetase/AMP-(fatty) acid ligase
MNSEDPLFLMYTSGTTGKPKGCQHGTGGYLAYVTGTSKYVQDIHPEDVYWCMADIGWITGHSYIVYGPLANCASTVIYEGVPTYPDAGRPGASPRTWTSTSSTPPPRPSAPCAKSARTNRPSTTTTSST